jgi:hypothetical protein
MLRRVAWIAGVALISSSTLLADFSYDETSAITGGMVEKMMKFAGAFSKKANQPVNTTIAVKGNKMVRRSEDNATIIDADAETITTISFQKRTYSVMTFEQMRQMMDQMSQKMKQNNNQMQFKVSVKPTGATREISGLNTKEVLVTMQMEATDQQSGQQGGMVITSDMWIAPSIRGYDEVRAFYKRVSQKLNWAPGTNMLAGNPLVSQGLSEAYKQASEMEGVPVEQTITIGGQPALANGNPPQSTPPQQQQQPSDTGQGRPSIGGAMGSALAGHFGFGHRRSKNQDQNQEQQQPSQGTSTPSDAGALMVMNTSSSNFSSNPVDSSLFTVPAGFTQIQPDTRRMH